MQLITLLKVDIPSSISPFLHPINTAAWYMVKESIQVLSCATLMFEVRKQSFRSLFTNLDPSFLQQRTVNHPQQS